MGHSSPPRKNGSTTTENTPLLASSISDELAVSVNEGEIIDPTIFKPRDESEEVPKPQDEEADKPLPKLQVFILCFARLVEPVAYFGIFPFINKMIKETGNLENEEVGFYSGVIESLFSLTQMMLMISWGKAADRIGRKPILVISLAGVAIATALFGFSKTIWQMILFRCFAGVFAGTIVTVRTMLSENSTAKTQARAFSFFAFAGNLGITFGPVIGGALASPAEQIGGIFKRILFFTEFPYALPTIVTGSIGAAAAIACAVLVKETLKRKSSADGTATPAPLSTTEIINSPGVPFVLFIYVHAMLLGLAYTAICPVLWFEPPELGGFGFSPLHISAFLAGIGVAQAAWILIAFPILQRKYGTGGVLRGCYTVWPIFFLSPPLCNYFLRRGWTTLFWIAAPALQIGGCGVSMAFACVQLALNDISPSPTSLGTLNGIALTMQSGIRTVAPAAFASLYAIGAERAKTNFLWGYLVWVALIAVTLVGSVGIWWLPEKAEGKVKDSD